jgi:Tol biopolymer transport system component
MKWLNGNRIRLVLVVFVVVILFSGSEVVKADFILGEPTNLGSVVNSESNDYDPHLMPDSLSLVFASDRPGGSGWSDLYITTRNDITDPWDFPTNLGTAVNSANPDLDPCLSEDELTLLFVSWGSGSSSFDIWMTTRSTTSAPWSNPVNLEAVNSLSWDFDPSLSKNGLELYFCSDRPDGRGLYDIWIATRETLYAEWGEPVNLSPLINTSLSDHSPCISSDGLTLFFCRGISYSTADLWAARRNTLDSAWEAPKSLGPVVNIMRSNTDPDVSADGLWLFWNSTDNPDNGTNWDIYQAPIMPVCDLNSDNKVDTADMHIMVDHWGENYPLCDIGPTPLGDGVVDIHDFTVLSEHLYRLTAHWKLDETDGDIAYDSFGDYDGTINGNPSWLPTGGIKGGSLMLDGIDDYIETPFILDPSKGSFSVIAWIYCWMPGQVIISQTGESGGTWLGTNPSGKLMSGFGDVNFGALESESLITDIQWHHVGFVYDKGTLHCRLYVDGVLVAEDATVVHAIPSDGGLYIGASKDLSAGTLFSGFIDDVRVYKQALTTEEITTLAQ